MSQSNQKQEAVKTSITAFVKVEGIHRWDGCHIEEVQYLKDDHRHMFHIRAWKQVNHDDRDIEFIQLSHQIKNYLLRKYWSAKHGCIHIQSRSCEMIAKELLLEFDLDKCEVLEDGEGGSIVER